MSQRRLGRSGQPVQTSYSLISEEQPGACCGCENPVQHQGYTPLSKAGPEGLRGSCGHEGTYNLGKARHEASVDAHEELELIKQREKKQPRVWSGDSQHQLPMVPCQAGPWKLHTQEEPLLAADWPAQHMNLGNLCVLGSPNSSCRLELLLEVPRSLTLSLSV